MITRIRSLILLIILTTSCSKSVIVKPNDISFAGITLYPNQTYDLVYAEYDVGGAALNLGKYRYRGDTLILVLDKQAYIKTLSKPNSNNCNNDSININLKEYISPYESSTISIFYDNITIKGISSNEDTVAVWNANSTYNQNNLNKIEIHKSELEGIVKIWLEIHGKSTTEPIHLPIEYDCLDITIPIYNVLAIKFSDRKLMQGMDEFIIQSSKKHYIVNCIQRKSKIKIRKSM